MVLSGRLGSSKPEDFMKPLRLTIRLAPWLLAAVALGGRGK
jgi:hypothetical protein